MSSRSAPDNWGQRDRTPNGARENTNPANPGKPNALDVFLSSLPPSSAAAPTLATASGVKAFPAPSASLGGAPPPPPPAPSDISGGKKRSRGRQAQASRSRRRRSGSEEWTPPRTEGEAASGPRTAATSSGPEDSVDGGPATTAGNLQKGCGNPVVQVSRDLKQSFDSHIAEQLRQCTVSVTEGGPEHAPVLGRVLQLACMALREMLDKNVVTAGHVRSQFGDFQAEHRARQSSPTKKQAQRRIGVRMPTDVLPLIVDTLGILSAARLWGANRMLIEFMFLCCMGRIPGIPMLVTPEVVVSATTGGPGVTAPVSGATRADSSVSNARAQAGRSISACDKRQDSAVSPQSPLSQKDVSQGGPRGIAKAAAETVARGTEAPTVAQSRIFRDSAQASKDAATIAAMAAGGFQDLQQPFPGAGKSCHQSQLSPGDSTFRRYRDSSNAPFQAPLRLTRGPLSQSSLCNRSPSPFGGSGAAERVASAVCTGAPGRSSRGEHTHLSPRPQSTGDVRHHAADCGHPRGPLRSTASAGTAIHSRVAAAASAAANVITQSQHSIDAMYPCHSDHAAGMMHGRMAMPATTGDPFASSMQARGQNLRRMASLYNEVTTKRGTSAAPMAAAGCSIDAGGIDRMSAPAAMDAGGMTGCDGAPVLFKEDTLKTLERAAAHLGNKSSVSDPATSHCSEHMKAAFASRAMGPAGTQQALDATKASDHEPAWYMEKLFKQPTLSNMAPEMPGSWDPLMAFPVEIAKEGSGEHCAPRETTLVLQPHGAAASGAANPSLRIEVLNTGLKDACGNDAKRRSCAGSSISDTAAAPQRGMLRSAVSAPGLSSKAGGGERLELKRAGESCMADVFASLNAQSHAFSSDDTATAARDGGLQCEPALAERSPGHTDDDHFPQLGHDVSFAVPDVLERSGDFGTKPIKSFASSGLWKMDTADMRTLEIDMAAMDKSGSERDTSMDSYVRLGKLGKLGAVTAD